MIQKETKPAEQITKVLKRIIERGLTTSSGGNISVCSPDGTVWITPSATDKGNMHASEIVKINKDGSFDSKYLPSVEYGFHCSIYKVRPDIHAIIHAHSAGLITFSIARCLLYTDLIEGSVLSKVRITSAEGDLPGSDVLRQNVTEGFENGYNAVLIDNHGIVIGADNLYEALCMLEELELSANIQLNALAMNRGLSGLSITRRGICNETLLTQTIQNISESELCEVVCSYVAREYRMGLFSSGIGRISIRAEEDAFYINTQDCDRKEPTKESMLKITKDTTCDKEAMLHRMIYEKNSQINSIVSGSPVHAMTVGVLPCAYEMRYDLESCLSFDKVTKIENGLYRSDIESVAKIIANGSGAAIIQNQCAITCGKSVFNAFDKMEILENGVKYMLNFNRIALKPYYMEKRT